MSTEKFKEAIKAKMREASCDGCMYAKTHEGIGCYMFADRGVCYVKRMAKNSEPKATHHK